MSSCDFSSFHQAHGQYDRKRPSLNASQTQTPACKVELSLVHYQTKSKVLKTHPGLVSCDENHRQTSSLAASQEHTEGSLQ